MRVSELSEQLGYELSGRDYEISGISYYDEANESDIAVAFYRDEINKTKAKVVLTAPVLLPTQKTLLMSYERTDLALVKVCRILIKDGVLPDLSLPVISKPCDKGYYIGENCRISENAVIYPGAVIGNHVTIENKCIIEPFVVIGSGTELAERVHIGSGSKIGAESFYHYYDDNDLLKHFEGCGKTIIADGTHIGSNTVIQRGTISNTVIGKSCMIGNDIDIGHDVKIGNNCKIVSQTGIAGRAVLKNDILVYGQVGISNNVTIGNHAIIKARTVVSKSVKDNETVFGLFGRSYTEELRLAVKIRRFFEGKEG